MSKNLLFFIKANQLSIRTNGVQLKVRLGEWDVGNTNELFPYQEFTVSRIFIHPQFSSSSLANSIAILRLTPTVPLGQIPTITTGCLPSEKRENRSSCPIKLENCFQALTSATCAVGLQDGERQASQQAQRQQFKRKSMFRSLIKRLVKQNFEPRVLAQTLISTRLVLCALAEKLEKVKN